MSEALLRVDDLKVHFEQGGGWFGGAANPLKAVDGVSLDLKPGQTLGLVGESGCGKSTLARALTGMVPVTSGLIMFLGQQVRHDRAASWKALRRDVQMIFQDPLASLDPRMTVGQIVAEPLRHLRPDLSRADRSRRVAAMIERVGLSQAHINRYPHEFSGGQCQRIGIARALVVEPKVLICDEPVSALDVSIQAKIVELLQQLQAEFGIALLFIAHDLAVVRQISDEVMVMYLGRVMERAPSDVLFDTPAHPYTRALLSAVPRPDPTIERSRRRIALPGELPSPADPPSGCVFRTRCPWAQADCGAQTPALRAFGEQTRVACLHAETVVEGRPAATG
ncbi:oligopeptide/dipeptide ABC transporter ATP-binding protein [Salinisphaera sp.]|uniref:ABC transporter ATP-binding protein n=1 Tax=Salinisphaera sp. TaxID=1914330 RepID=UPI000C376757|nr:oligopeptide/dipeptide ABC transporter ATP-binding protein [Salinisphaera sp.]MBS62978.1 oligopeptide ABC transporter ATP-binding protein OppF [Salinisphaera sp.]